MHICRCSRVAAFAVGAMVLALAGCNETAEIRAWDAPKLKFEEGAFAGLEAQQDTILAALVPQDDQAWVFRLSGPKADVAASQADFESFVASLAFADGQTLPDWELPEGWEATPAPPGSMREASVRVPVGDDGKLDLSVSRLPIHEDWLHYRLRNFNRWRRQLQLPIGHASDLAEASHEVALEKSPSATASIIAMSGLFAESASRGMGMPGMDGMPPAQSSAPAADATSPGLTYETPPGWTEGPLSSVRRASFVIRDSDAAASVSVTAFPVTGRMAEPLANINRWRNEVLLSPIVAAEIADGTESFEVDGLPGLYVPLDGSEDAASGGLATRAVMVERGDRVWFFKMHGDKSLVAQETDHFQDFVRSVEFIQ